MGELKIQMEKALQRNFTGMVKQPLCQFRFEKNQPATPGAERLRSYMRRFLRGGEYNSANGIHHNR